MQHFARLRGATGTLRRGVASVGTNASRYDVVVVGGGPTGMVLGHLLQQHGVDHLVVERRSSPTTHPQAHFINARTMEIIQTHMPDVFQALMKDKPALTNWRHFAYVHRVLGTELARVDHFARVPAVTQQKWLHSPSDVLHYPQHGFEALLASLGKGNISRGWNVEDVGESQSAGSKCVTMKSTTTGELKRIHTQFVVAADGANSGIRSRMGIPMKGSQNLQSLINVHFSSPELAAKLVSRPAMLYFVYNQDVVCVLVTQNPMKGEYVCQIPFFYPHESVEEFSAERCLRLIRHAVGDSGLQAEILSIKPWTMHAQVAERWVDDGVILAGDAAHRFPPAGGFGMNTGIQDAHDLAWRLASLLRGDSDAASLDSYSSERRAVAHHNTELSLINYEKTAQLASLLGVDPDLGKKILQLTSSVVPKAFQKAAIQGILTAGRAPLATLSSSHNIYGKQRVSSFQRRIAQGGDLSLLFPEHDVGYRYPQRRNGPSHLPTAVPEWLTVGRRVPHAWVVLAGNVLASTVHLPWILSKVRKRPLFVVVCHANSKDSWESILGGQQSWAVIAVQEKVGEAVPFETLQKAAVRPLLEQTSGQPPSGDVGMYKFWTDLDDNARTAELTRLAATNALADCTSLDGQWFSKLCRGQDGSTLFDLIVRPDGHIGEVCSVDASETQRRQLLNLTAAVKE